MLIIRLQRTGAKNSPDFRLVLAEKHRAAQKKTLEVLGQYSPKTKELKLKNEARLKEWVGRNVELSPTVRNLLITKKLISGNKVKAWNPKKSAKAEAAAGEKEAPAAPVAPAEAPKEEAKAS